MIFIEWIEALDIQLLLLINGLSSPFLDNLMWTFSSKLFGVPFYLIFIFILFKNKPFRSAITCTFLLVLVVVLSDLTAKYCFKEVFQRFRPSHNLILKDQLTFLNKSDGTFYIGGLYGFISSHACNMFALSFLFYKYIKNKFPKSIWLLLFWASLISFSRIYLGVHFPSDVIVGGIVGIVIAQFLYYLSNEFKWVEC
mgnify:FL=1